MVIQRTEYEDDNYIFAPKMTCLEMPLDLRFVSLYFGRLGICLKLRTWISAILFYSRCNTGFGQPEESSKLFAGTENYDAS